tara:strand:+ start:22969 stop:23325 length:357 start_codon:yes stop_codon:yes gene_type:complete
MSFPSDHELFVPNDDTTIKPPFPKYKYGEPEALTEALEYISKTYGEHYVGDEEIQALDYFASVDIAETIGFCRFNAMKYLARFGKKKGKNDLDLLKAIHYTILLKHFVHKQSGEKNES